MSNILTRADAQVALDTHFKRQQQRLDRFYDLLESGITLGKKIYLELPDDEVKGNYMVTTVDAFNFVISLEPYERNGIYVRDLVKSHLDCEPNVLIIVKN